MKLIFVEWLDACEMEAYHKEDYKGESLGLQKVYSLGFVVKETDVYIAVAQSLSANGWYKNIISIPKVGIVTTKEYGEDESINTRG